MTLFVGIDIGTTRIKVGCYDTDAGRLIALHAAPTPVEDDPWGGRRDAQQLRSTVHELLALVLAEPEVSVPCIGAVAVGSFGEEVVLLDAHGRVTAPVLAWHARHGRETRDRMQQDAALSPGYGAMDDTFSVFKLAWLARHQEPEVARSAVFTDVADFVAWDLLGDPDADVFINLSHASRTGLLDLDRRALRDDLEALGVGALSLPRLVPSGTVVGFTSGHGPLPAGVPVVTGGHDHFCGAFGAGVRRAGDVYISAGTSEAQLVLLDVPPADVPDGIDEGAFVAADLTYLHRATPSGRYYQSWHEALYAGASDDTLWSEVTPWVSRVEPATVEAGGLRLGALPVDMTRAQAMTSLLSGLADEAERTTTRLEQLAGRPVETVTVAGVPASRAAWRRLRAAASPRRLRFVTEPEATVLGVALLAQHGATGRADLPVTMIDAEGNLA